MVSKLIDAILGQRLLVVSSAVLLLIGGLYAFKLLNIEAYPDPLPPLLRLLRRTLDGPQKRWSARSPYQSRRSSMACLASTTSALSLSLAFLTSSVISSTRRITTLIDRKSSIVCKWSSSLPGYNRSFPRLRPSAK